ncbi:MAG: hypothetical protein ACTSO8_07110 [Promethearchaeota archaeon]
MSESDYDQEIEFFGQEKGIEQLELLFQLFNERKRKDTLIKELDIAKKSLKRGSIEEISIRVKNLRRDIRDYKSTCKSLKSKIGSSYNIFEIKKEIEENTRYSNNLSKNHKKGLITLNAYETTRIDYAQKIEKGLRYIKRLKLLAQPFFSDLKEEAYSLENERITLRSERLERKFSKGDYSRQKKEIDKKKSLLRKKLAFLNSEIFDFHRKN